MNIYNITDYGAAANGKAIFSDEMSVYRVVSAFDTAKMC